MTLLRNPFDPAWGILMTLIQIYWGILLAPDNKSLDMRKFSVFETLTRYCKLAT
jgi:hypothetical protein